MADRPPLFTEEFQEWLRTTYPDYDPYAAGTPASQTEDDRRRRAPESPGDAGAAGGGDAGASGDAGTP